MKRGRKSIAVEDFAAIVMSAWAENGSPPPRAASTTDQTPLQAAVAPLSCAKAECCFRFQAHHNAVTCLCLVRGVLFTGGADGRVHTWVSQSGGDANHAPGDHLVELTGHRGTVRCIAPCGSQLVCSGGHDGTVRAWRVDTGEEFAVLPAFPRGLQAQSSLLPGGASARPTKAWVRCLAGNADGALAVGYQDGAVRLWHPSTGEVTWDIVGHTKAVLCVALGSECVYTGAADGAIRGWSLKTGP